MYATSLGRRKALAISAGIFGIALGLVGCGGGSAATDQTSAADTSADSTHLTLSKSALTTTHSIGIIVTTGAGGAPNGFTLQWIKASHLDVFWSPWPADTALLCAAGFFGGELSYSPPVGKNESVELIVEDHVHTAVINAECGGPMDPGTDYVFRVRTNSQTGLPPAPWTSTYTLSTLPN